MSILSDFEDRVGRAIEGVFSGVFRAPVQPAEIARAAAKEMDRRKRLGVGKVYAPTAYSVLLSPDDARSLGGFTDTLAGELETYLLGYADERDYELAHRPRVRFLVDDELRLGRFEVIGELLSPEEIAAEFTGEDRGVAADSAPVASPDRASVAGPPPFAAAAGGGAGESPAAAAQPIPTAPQPGSSGGTPAPLYDDDVFAPTGDLEPVAPPTPRLATVTVPGIHHDVALTGDRAVMGRLKTCDICLQDANASREHAALEREGAGWTLVDLGSMNGTMVNGERVDRARLTDGDIITVGVTELVFHEPGS